MTVLNRFVAALLWLFLLITLSTLAVAPFWLLEQVQGQLTLAVMILQQWQIDNATNFIIGQATVGIVVIILFGALFWLEVWSGQQRGAVIRTIDGGSAELDTSSISRRLEWHLEQVAEVSNVVPIVRARGGAVDIRLEVEVAPEVDIPMKTDEVVGLTRDIIEDDIGLRLGKLDVHLRCAPFEPTLV